MHVGSGVDRDEQVVAALDREIEVGGGVRLQDGPVGTVLLVDLADELEDFGLDFPVEVYMTVGGCTCGVTVQLKRPDCAVDMQGVHGVDIGVILLIFLPYAVSSLLLLAEISIFLLPEISVVLLLALVSIGIDELIGPHAVFPITNE